MGYTLRTDTYRYTEWQDRNSGEIKARELYDHSASHEESANIIEQADKSATIDALSEQLASGYERLAANV